MKKSLLDKTLMAAAVTLPLLYGGAAMAQSQGQSGTTLAAYKTIDICSLPDGKWRYSGEISVWNEGSTDTEGCKINDIIENKVGNKWVTVFTPLTNFSCGVIPAGTTQQTALTFPYSVDGQMYMGDIRNTATVTITNHSGSLGKDKGPSPKATFTGTVEPCPTEGGCTYTQGYWKNHTESWPSGYSPDAVFFLSGKTWLQVLNTPTNESQGYYQLAHQYIAAVLNKANGASVPQGVQDTLNLASAWLGSNAPSACTSPSSCGTQKTWAGILDDYNNGEYEGGPGHCE